MRIVQVCSCAFLLFVLNCRIMSKLLEIAKKAPKPKEPDQSYISWKAHEKAAFKLRQKGYRWPAIYRLFCEKDSTFPKGKEKNFCSAMARRWNARSR